MSPSNYLVEDALVALPAKIPFEKQSLPLPGTKRPGQTAHYVNAMWGLLDPAEHRLKTVADIFISGMSLGKDRPLLGHRPVLSKKPLTFANRYEWLTYGQVDVRRRNLGSGLLQLFSDPASGVGGGELETVGIWSINRPEWQIVDLALMSYKKVNVSFINHAHLTIIFATLDHIPALLKLAPKTPQLKVVVSMDVLSADVRQVFGEWGQSVGVSVVDMGDIEALGLAHLSEPIPPSPEDIASICYTSGTTSMPKGAVLTHGQLSSSVVTNLLGLNIPSNTTMMSYLPLAHIYERVNEQNCIAVGGNIGFFTGDPLRLIEDCQILKPAFFPGVPRVLNRVYQSAMAAANVPGFKGDLFRRAMAAKLEKFRATGDNTHFFWDKLVFRKIQAVLGGNILLVTSGSAPISGDVVDFLNVAFGCQIIEGYGMTETCAVATKTWPGDASAGGSVGPPQSANLIKLVDVPAMNYTSEDKPNPRGEMCVKGINTFLRYYKGQSKRCVLELEADDSTDEKNTASTIDSEGWLHTGDVAEIDSCGRFRIIDRVKNIMKLAQGEYVALEKVENTYSTVPVVAQLYVHGDSLQSFLIGVVVADPIQLAPLVSRVLDKKVASDDLVALSAACKDEGVVASVLNLLSKEAKKNALKGFETVKRIHLTLDMFTVEEGTMTPTMKLRRKDAYNKFQTELDALYALGEPSSSSTKL
ncbi:unnamed protein product [Mycena citricolor]|uniref:AMP-dependent synthetase/ligase domain-containing protein n=1 Tax=Mycena citricolor TaxID=2018698 RepID=A0AAD2GX43_9AGAR|nr:unnamed protein product [Mycena citricolor]